MVEHKHSTDSKRDTDQYLTDAPTPSQSGSAGGDLAREIGAEDDVKREDDPNASVTRVHKSDTEKRGAGNLGKQNR